MPDDRLTETEIHRVAAEAECDPRTVRAFLAGDPTRARVSDRIRRAIEHVGVVRGDVNGAVPTTERKA
jgi:hypothetical protein